MTYERKEDGQATAELAAIIPIFVFLLVLVVQVGLVMLDQLAVTNAAREGARVAAVDPDPGSAVAAVTGATRLNQDNLEVVIGNRPKTGGLVKVTVTYRPAITVPFTDRVIYRPVLEGQASMRVEKA